MTTHLNHLVGSVYPLSLHGFIGSVMWTWTVLPLY